jgi:glyceraldehyde 3-phosphate dehydrogenase
VADPAVLAQLLARDSVYGRFREPVRAGRDMLLVGHRTIIALRQTEPEALPWADLDVDVVIESTGRFRTRDEALRRLAAGARKVILSTPAKGAKPADANVLLGVNFDAVNNPKLLDAPHKDLRRARAAAVNLAPTSTGAAKALGLVIPELEGRLNGFAVRVPMSTGSIVDLTIEAEHPRAHISLSIWGCRAVTSDRPGGPGRAAS